ncbi:MAG: glucose-1-phosphate cytidylyltransferase [Geminicoccaceae bacterium]
MISRSHLSLASSNSAPRPADTPVFILCGGLGTRLREETEFRPKPMVPIGDQPILVHIMRWYAKFGFKRFILCAGYRSEVIRQYFANFHALNDDFTVDLAANSIEIHPTCRQPGWRVTVAYTGELTMTGARLRQAASRYLDDAETFAVTYGDGLTDADLRAELEDHHNVGRLGTVLGVNPPARFGEFRFEGDHLTSFAEKPERHDSWINGGFFFFERAFLSYLGNSDDCILEQEPLTRLAGNGELHVHKHGGYWACMDTLRDRMHLNDVWARGEAPWAA